MSLYSNIEISNNKMSKAIKEDNHWIENFG